MSVNAESLFSAVFWRFYEDLRHLQEKGREGKEEEVHKVKERGSDRGLYIKGALGSRKQQLFG